MRSSRRLSCLLFSSIALLAACSRSGDRAPASAAAAPASSAAAKSYPFRGVITDVVAAQSALMVKHEDIPGLMPAMTMLFKVDAATLKAAIKDQTITATLVQEGGDFWLRDVKAAPTQK